MTRNSVLVLLIVISVNCAYTLKCLEGINEGNCTLSEGLNGQNETSLSKPTTNSTKSLPTASPTPYIQEITTHTAKPVEKPKALNMLTEDQMDSGFQPNIAITTTVPTTTTIITTTSLSTTEPKGRALNFTVGEHSNGLSNTTKDDLSDVSMDDDHEDDMKVLPVKSAKILAAKSIEKNTSVCEKGGLTYDEGEKLEVGCDSVCTCSEGKMDCVDRCVSPFIRKGKKVKDPFCREKASKDPCCSVLQCTADTETEPLEICSYNNKTYNRGDVIQENCTEICNCEAAGKLSCKPRCAPITKTSDKCLEIPDMDDPCCRKLICDVTLKDNKLISAKYVNSSTIKFEFETKLEMNQTLPLIDISDEKKDWKTFTLLPGGYLSGLETNYKYVKIENTDDVIEIQNFDDVKKVKENKKVVGKNCEYKGKEYKINEEFSDKCDSFCVCKESGVKCLKMECPTYFGTDVLDPNCIEWETVPSNFTPTPPNCCPEKLECKNNGSCDYKGETYQNWAQIPLNITGCEKRCYCEMGKVECQNVCPPVTALPPANLECSPQHATLSNLPGDDCCVYWMCNQKSNGKKPIKTEENEGQEIVENKTDTPTISSFPFIPSKIPSKTLGPLLVYTNNDNKSVEHDLNLQIISEKRPTKTDILPDENHYFSKDSNESHIDKDTYLGPFNPSFKQQNTKIPSNKGNKNKPNKNAMFVTPPSIQSNDNYIPDKEIPSIPLPNAPHIRIHGKGNPEDLLHIINQHPEIANYPPGSVLEIHNIPQRPYAPNPNSIYQQSRPNNNYPDPNKNLPLPPGVTLEQILQEIHKSGQTNNVASYSPQFPNSNHQNFPINNGQIFVPPQINNGRPQSNITQSGHPGMFPNGFPNIPGYQQPHDDINVHILDALDAHTIRLAFTVPPVIVGLHGRVEVRYTHKSDDDQNNWELQVFAPPNDLIATPQLEFDLVELKPDTQYKIKITITLRDLHNTPTSRVYTIRTLKEPPTSTLPPMIPIEPELVITDINATWVNVAWRKFTEYELQFIDGVQLRFKEIDGKIYAATALLHRAVTEHTLENLKPNTKYEIGIFFIPFSGQQTELHAEHMLHFTTANEVDTYGFNVTLEISLIKATNVEITWSGVPYPEDKYVNIYRAIYQSDSGKGDSSSFKIAKRDSPPKTSILDLKPGTRYRLWLEIYLTNGKIKTSNVQDFITKPRSAPITGASSKQDKLSGELPEHKGDYYGPLVIVAILAAIAILSTLVLLLILVRRHSMNKAAITPPSRVSQSAYDNPTYKVEIQQETMDL